MPAISDTTEGPGRSSAEAGRVSRITGKAPLSRSDAARHASLVRWNKEQPFAARLAAIREARKRGGKAPKGKKAPKAAKPKVDKVAERAKQQAANRDLVKNAMADADAGLAPKGFDNLMALGEGQEPDKAGADGLISMGMAERGSDGTLRLTASGREAIHAADRGDAKGAIDAVSRGVDQAKGKSDRETAKQERASAQAQHKQELAQRDKERADKQAAREKAQQQKKASASGGKKKEGAPSSAPSDKEAARLEQTKENQDKVQSALEAQGGRSLNKDAFGHLLSFANGDQADPDTLDALASSTGLLERDSSGGYRMTTEGSAYVRAASRGDVRAAGDALSKAMDKIAPKDTSKQPTSAGPGPNQQVRLDKRAAARTRRRLHLAKKDTDMADLEYIASELDAIKAGARHNKTDKHHVDAIAMAAHALGGQCPDCMPDDDAVKAMMDDPDAYAAHECGDVMSACSALCNLAMLVQSELSEEDEDDDKSIAQLIAGMRTLLDFIGGEIDEIEEAMKQDAEEDAGEAKAISARDDVSPKEGEREYGDVRFADAKNKRYPIDTEAHIRAAWNYINQEKNAAKYEASEVATIKRNIIAAWKQKIDKAGPPSAEKKDAEAEIDAILAANGYYSIDGDEVKTIAGDMVRALAIRFGSDSEPDMSQVRDYFTKSTDYWLDAWDRRPMLYHHALDESTRDAPRIGTWTKATIDDAGVWLEGQLDRAHRYYGAIKELIKRGALRVSTDSAPHLVLREARQNGTHEVKRWPLMAASLTPTPAEPRLSAVSLKAFLAEIGLDAIDDSTEAQEEQGDRQDAAKALDDRARELLLTIDILELEETAL